MSQHVDIYRLAIRVSQSNLPAKNDPEAIQAVALVSIAESLQSIAADLSTLTQMVEEQHLDAKEGRQ